jgi:hypothetical protein
MKTCIVADYCLHCSTFRCVSFTSSIDKNKIKVKSAHSTGEDKRRSDVSVVKLSTLLSSSKLMDVLSATFINDIVIGDEEDRLGLRGTASCPELRCSGILSAICAKSLKALTRAVGVNLNGRLAFSGVLSHRQIGAEQDGTLLHLLCLREDLDL